MTSRQKYFNGVGGRDAGFPGSDPDGIIYQPKSPPTASCPEPQLLGAKSWEPRGFSRVAAGFSSYNGDLSLTLGLALGSPIFPSSCEGKLGAHLSPPSPVFHSPYFPAAVKLLKIQEKSSLKCVTHISEFPWSPISWFNNFTWTCSLSISCKRVISCV